MEYLFCDKTGTLTENCMEFRQCSINGRLYIEEGGSFIRNHPLEAELEAEKAARKVKSTDSAANTRESVGLRLSVDAAGLAGSLEMDQSKMTKETQLDEVDGVCGTIPFFSPFFLFLLVASFECYFLVFSVFFYYFSFCILWHGSNLFLFVVFIVSNVYRVVLMESFDLVNDLQCQLSIHSACSDD